MEAISNFFSNPQNISALIEVFFFILLVILSAMISGSEVAFFSLTPTIIQNLEDSSSNAEKKIFQLLQEPDKLLATILITNNFVNIAIVVLSTYITATLIDFGTKIWLKFVVEAVVVTFVILLFGEIIPKIYANKFKKRFASKMSIPLSTLQTLLYPFVIVLVKSTNIVNKKIQSTEKLSMSDISYAIDITSGQTQNEKKILKSVVNLSNVEAREIMTPRVDVVTIDFGEKLSVVKKIIEESEFSRIPVVKDTLDNVVGVLFIKDLLKFINKDNYFEWQKLVKTAYFVPENKKIDDLLQEFRTKKYHMAIVSDEYAGFSGIVTLEDIIEEIVGEINDEYDVPDTMFSKLGDNKFLIDGKLLLKDLQKPLNINDSFFDEIKGDAETIAGLLLEINGDFPSKNQKIKYKNLTFTVQIINKRRIVKLILDVT